ncbi:MAG: glycosyl transferase [Candidatus Andersenbacteria bacterium RIFCSPHIGHO2_12_FULL_46_9]|nr:MAG: glycosyl transferase [Candidatus Andersenbacteria bacterium RIFCSPHIGHO2_02_FULL_46_16]OGY37585.1 MAG: glycosyl transferase [Candidatus Andersenbacteria bacterium RIFCSPHIGHO2_12_FULL_46_9]OGY39470.1 MAG: glycosyl transferase [Candidatus Andersenbacteria bacterium RIFCSPLOWO2_12_FULL_45_8]HBE90765.1 glycosyl transferase [Candidatus Andersenbacteria bacterium]
MRVAMLAPIHWRTPPQHYGPWELVASLITEGLVKQGVDVTLFASRDSLTKGRLHAIADTVGEGRTLGARVWEVLHIAEAFEHANEFDLIHSHYDWQPLTYSRLVSVPVVTTIHGLSSAEILPAYKKYNDRVAYVSISTADRHPELKYAATVYHGIDLNQFTFKSEPGQYLVFFGRISHDKGAREAIEVALQTKLPLVLAGITPEKKYFEEEIKPLIDGQQIRYVGNAGPKERDRLLGDAIALLHLINFDEPFGLAPVEAMACGTPVIAMTRGSMPEIIKDGATGFLVQTLEEAVTAVGRIKSIDRETCRRHVADNFSVEKMVEGYLGVYQKLLAA